MPSVINGAIKFTSVSGGTINFGDTAIIAPKNVTKEAAGAGGTTGDFSRAYTGVSNTNMMSSSGVDTTNTSKV